MADEQTYAERVTEVVDKAEKNDAGSLALSDEALTDVPEDVAFAAKTELKYRNTQSVYTRSQTALSAANKINEGLTSQLEESLVPDLTTDQQTELNVLKKSDPDKWKEKLGEYESKAKTQLSSKIKEINEKGGEASEVDLRKEKLKVFTEKTGIALDDTIIANNLPASYKLDLDSGKLSFDDFLLNTEKFLTKGKVIEGAGEGNENDNDKDMSGGRTEPSKTAKDGDIVETYKKTIF